MNQTRLSFLPKVVMLWERSTPTLRWRIVLGVIAVALAIWLLLAPKPWVAAMQIRGKMETLDYVRIYAWIAGAINLALLGVLAAVCPWWSKLSTTGLQPSPGHAKTPRWFWPLVAAAMALTFCYSLPRMNHGFWDDEELNVRTTLYGKFKTDKKTGEVEFKRFNWLETVYGYSRGPNSHTLFGVFSRACEEAWNSVARPKVFPLVEWPFRVPALIFGVIAVAAVACLLREFGLPSAGVAAAFLLAIHPWHIRYSSEARGYSLLVLLVPLLFIFWNRAMATGRWKWWSAFALTEFSLIYCYPGALFVLIVLNLITLGLIAAGKSAEPGAAQAGRWFCANVFATILALQLMLPLYPQAKQYFDFVSSQGFVSGWSWVRNTVCFMIGGAPWTKSGEPWEGYPEWLARYVENPFLFAAAGSLATVVILVGAFFLLRRGWPSATFVFVMAIGPPITFVFAYFRKFLLYENYVIYSLPGAVVCAATGLTVMASWARRLPGGGFIVPAAASLAVVGYFLYTNPIRHWIVANPLQQIRESVIYCRGTLDPSSSVQKGVRTASFCIPPYLYDAYMERLDSAGAFIAALKRADQEHVPLLLNIGMPWAARQYSPQMWALFTNRALFEEPVRLRGFEPSLDRLVAKYKPRSAENFDFSQYKFEER